MWFRGEPGAVMDGQDVTQFAFNGNGVGVVIRDLEVTRFTADSQLGAIQGYDGRDWVLENLNVHHNRGYGANLRGHFTVLGGSFHHNSRLGIGVHEGAGGIIDGVDLSFNNPDTLFDPLWEAGGIKITASDSVVVRRCFVHNNVGPGIWYDGDNWASVVTDNIVTANSHMGIMYEISLSGTIRGNTVTGNGVANSGPYGAGILVAASQDVEIDHNTLANNSQGIIGIQEERGSGRFGPHLITNLWVHDNNVTLGTGASGLLNYMSDGSLYARNNRFDLNVYTATGDPLPFYIDVTNRVSRSAWQARGLDQNSTFIGP
jgi:parallel beta-helix repeat protein